MTSATAFVGSALAPLRRHGRERLATLRMRPSRTPPLRQRPTRACADDATPPPWAEQVAPLFERAVPDAGARVRAFDSQPRAYVAVQPLVAATDAAWLAPLANKRSYYSNIYVGGGSGALRTPLPARRGALDRVLFEEAVARTRSAIADSGTLAPPPPPPPPCLASSDVAMLLLSAREFVASMHPRGGRRAGRGDARTAQSAAQYDISSSDVFSECIAEATSAAFPTALDLFARVCQSANRAVLCASVEEVETIDDDNDALNVAGFLYLTAIRRLYGEDVPVGTVVQVKCPSPAFAAALSTALNVSCFVPRYIFDAASASFIIDASGAAVIAEEDQDAEVRRGSNDRRKIVQDAASVHSSIVPSHISYKEVMSLSDGAVRSSLRAAGVAARSQEDRRSLLRKFADLMDEVERRELLIELAADDQLWGLAAELQRGRSERGVLVRRMRDAEERADWDEVFRIKCEVDRVKDCLADPTQEPGSYDPYLDQDPWYKPSR